jgi:perosamine synthetase
VNNARSDLEPLVRVGEPAIGDDERALVNAAMDRGEIGHFGRHVREFEQLFSRFCGVNYGVAASSGTGALHLALAALGIGPGDEVILPTLTMIATANAVRYTGASPVLVDCEPNTWTMDPDQIAEKMTDRTRAIIAVHLFGHPCDMNRIRDIADKHDVRLIEDAAQAHGAECRGVRTGCFGDISAFSFYVNKVITTGEGGMVVTNDSDLAARARRLGDQAFDPLDRFRHSELGFNYRMTNLQAALGVGQMKRIEQIIARKRYIADRYHALLSGVRGLTLPHEEPWARSVFWMFAILVEDDFGLTRDQLMTFLARRGIETRRFFIPIHSQPIYTDLYEAEAYLVADQLSLKGLYLPSGLGMSDDDIDLVSRMVIECRP